MIKGRLYQHTTVSMLERLYPASGGSRNRENISMERLYYYRQEPEPILGIHPNISGRQMRLQ